MVVDWVREAESLARDVLEGQALEVDRAGRIPSAHFDALAELGFYGFPLSEGMAPGILIDTAATVISGCLATGFVWAQHLGALRAVVSCDNAALREQAAEAGDPQAMNNLANLLSARGRADEAERWLRMAVDAGSGAAMNNLGSMFFQRERVTEYEYWWRRGAEAGDATSMYNLAVVLEVRDRDEAARLFRAAAAAGHPNAEEKLEALLTRRTRMGAPYIAGIF